MAPLPRTALIAGLLLLPVSLGTLACDGGGESESDTQASTGPATSDPTEGTTDPSTTMGTTSTTSTTNDASSSSTGDPTEFEMTIYPDIIAPNCSCHVQGSQGGLIMSSGANAYNSLVDQPSQAPDRMLVTPGDASVSYLVDKLRGTHLDVGGSGDQMPKGGGQLAEGDIAAVEAWINGGAL